MPDYTEILQPIDPETLSREPRPVTERKSALSFDASIEGVMPMAIQDGKMDAKLTLEKATIETGGTWFAIGGIYETTTVLDATDDTLKFYGSESGASEVNIGLNNPEYVRIIGYQDKQIMTLYNASTKTALSVGPLVGFNVQNYGSTATSAGNTLTLQNAGTGNPLNITADGSGAQINLSSYGTTPSSLNAGDIWRESDDLYFRDSSATRTLIHDGATNWIDLTDGGATTLHTHAADFTNLTELTLAAFSYTANVITDGSVVQFPSVFIESSGTAVCCWDDDTNSKTNASVSTDGGNTWGTIVSDIFNTSTHRNGTDRGVYTPDGTNMFAAGIGVAGGLLLAKSTNSGGTWTVSTVSATAQAAGGAAIQGLSSTELVVLYYYSTGIVKFTKSTDGGSTWSSPVTVDTFDTPSNYFLSMSVIDSDNIWACFNTKAGAAIRIDFANTDDGGSSWNSRGSLSQGGDGACSISAVDTSEIWVIADDATQTQLFKSTGAGFSTVNTTSTYFRGISIYAPESDRMLISGLDSAGPADLYITESNDGGTTLTENKMYTGVGASSKGTSIHGVDYQIVAVKDNYDSGNLSGDYSVSKDVSKFTDILNKPLKPTGGSYIYSRGGELYGMDTAGNEVNITA